MRFFNTIPKPDRQCNPNRSQYKDDADWKAKGVPESDIRKEPQISSPPDLSGKKPTSGSESGKALVNDADAVGKGDKKIR